MTNGTAYFYVVSAVNATGESANSSPASATPVAATANVTITIDPTKTKPISPYIYGINFYSGVTGAPPQLTFDRAGGNRWTAYNWETNASNAGSDYLYENDDFLTSSTVPAEAVRTFIAGDQSSRPRQPDDRSAARSGLRRRKRPGQRQPTRRTCRVSKPSSTKRAPFPARPSRSRRPPPTPTSTWTNSFGPSIRNSPAREFSVRIPRIPLSSASTTNPNFGTPRTSKFKAPHAGRLRRLHRQNHHHDRSAEEPVSAHDYLRPCALRFSGHLQLAGRTQHHAQRQQLVPRQISHRHQRPPRRPSASPWSTFTISTGTPKNTTRTARAASTSPAPRSPPRRSSSSSKARATSGIPPSTTPPPTAIRGFTKNSATLQLICSAACNPKSIPNFPA